MEIFFTLFIIWIAWLIWKAFTNQKTAESRLLDIKKIISNGQYKVLIIENYEDGIQNHETARQIIQIEVRNLVDAKVLDKSYLEDEKFLNQIDASYVVAQVEVEYQIKLFKMDLGIKDEKLAIINSELDINKNISIESKWIDKIWDWTDKYKFVIANRDKEVLLKITDLDLDTMQFGIRIN